MAELTNHQKCKMIVSKLVSKTRWDETANNINWPKEIKIAKKLLQKFPEKKFWKTLYIEERPTSLSWFLTTDGNMSLCQHSQKMKGSQAPLQKIAEVKLNATKIGEDAEVKLPPTNLMEFMIKKK